MSKYYSPTIHHEDIVDEVAIRTESQKTLFRKTAFEALKLVASPLEDSLSFIYQSLNIIPDTYRIIKRDDGRLDIHIFEVVKTNQISREKFNRLTNLTETLEEFSDCFVYIYYIDANTRGVAKLDFDMAYHRVDCDKKANIDYRPLVMDNTTVDDLKRIFDAN